MADCIVPGGPVDGKNNLGVRLRRPNTSAIWAPNTEGFVCDHHATTGARLTLLYEPTETGAIEVGVVGVGEIVSRTTSINTEHEPAATLVGRIRDNT